MLTKLKNSHQTGHSLRQHWNKIIKQLYTHCNTCTNIQYNESFKKINNSLKLHLSKSEVDKTHILYLKFEWILKE
jgi:choline kinase